MPKRIIRIGPAGWSYKDWEGIVYPQKPGKSFDPLEYLQAIPVDAGLVSGFEASSNAFRRSRCLRDRFFGVSTSTWM